jgi:hypothetical protein
MDKVPVYYANIYLKIREKNKGGYISKTYLKEIVGRVICHPLLSSFKKEVINDLISLGLIEKINLNTFRIIDKHCEERVKKIYENNY